MTTKEKLEKALEALKHIELHTIKCESVHKIASEIYKELTTPRTEPVEYKADSQSPNSVWYVDEKGTTVRPPKDAEIIIRFERPIPKPETWEGEVIDEGFLGFDVRVRCDHKPGLLGKKVIVEVKNELRT